MNAIVKSAVLSAVGVTLVNVEVQVSDGLPGLFIVGLADTAVCEARERVRAALKSVKVTLPAKRIVVNLAPASEKKSGSSLDIAIALAILCAIGRLNTKEFENCLCVGELSIDGSVQPCAGMMAYLAYAQSQGLVLLSLVESVAGTINIEAIRSVNGLGDLLSNCTRSISQQPKISEPDCLEDYSEVIGQNNAINAALIALVGGHHLLLVGSPGCGKTMVASRMRSILPELTAAGSLEVSQIYGRTSAQLALIQQPPFREPHHSATTAGMVGGGNPFQVGEITLAHQGVLFLDELPEFKPSVLQLLRQPLETGYLVHVRAKENWKVPAQFLLVATANPCPCGYYGTNTNECTCSAGAIRQYRNRIGGPLLDRIDLVVSMASEPLHHVSKRQTIRSSSELLDVVTRGRNFRLERIKHSLGTVASVAPEYESLITQFSTGALAVLKEVENSSRYSTRKLLRLMRVARTLADISHNAIIDEESLYSAVTYCSEWIVASQ